MTRLAVVYGGPSAEAAVSKVSADAVFRAPADDYTRLLLAAASRGYANLPA